MRSIGLFRCSGRHSSGDELVEGAKGTDLLATTTDLIERMERWTVEL